MGNILCFYTTYISFSVAFVMNMSTFRYETSIFLTFGMKFIFTFSSWTNKVSFKEQFYDVIMNLYQ